MTCTTEPCICLLREINTSKEHLDFKNALDKYNGHPSNKWISFLLLTKMSTARNLDFMCPYTNSSTVLFFFYCSHVLKGNQFLFQAAVTLLSQSIQLLEEGLLYLSSLKPCCGIQSVFRRAERWRTKNKWQLLKACEEPGDWYSLASELGQENTVVKMLPRIML